MCANVAQALMRESLDGLMLTVTALEAGLSYQDQSPADDAQVEGFRRCNQVIKPPLMERGSPRRRVAAHLH